MGSELLGIDKDRDHDAIGASQPLSHQRQMAIMERTHGRDHGGSQRLRAPAGDHTTQMLHGSNCFDGV